jgi:GT2 family glycosyltransferase
MSSPRIHSSKKNSAKTTVLIVSYNSEPEIWACVKSLQENKTHPQIIVIDNAAEETSHTQQKKFQQKLAKLAPTSSYLPQQNLGYGAALNAGAKRAKTQYLLILNPDCQLTTHSLQRLEKYLDTHPETLAVAPAFATPDGQRYQAGAMRLTPWTALWSTSLLHRLLPNNPIAQRYFIPATITEPTPAEVIPGTAFLIRRNNFEKVRGFDPQFFLYFEELDLFERLKQETKKTSPDHRVMLLPSSLVLHHGGTSTKNSTLTQAIFRASRWRYFHKHFGFFAALTTTSFLSVTTQTVMIICLATTAAFFFFIINR